MNLPNNTGTIKALRKKLTSKDAETQLGPLRSATELVEYRLSLFIMEVGKAIVIKAFERLNRQAQRVGVKYD